MVIDATCPLVDKVHREVRKFAAQGYWIVLIGHESHDEIVGTSGEAPGRIRIVADVEEARAVDIPDPDKVIVLTQTTLSVDDTREVIDVLKERFPRMITPAKEDICYATQNRQDAVKQLAREVDLVLVLARVTAKTQTNFAKWRALVGRPLYLIDDCHAIDPTWLVGVRTGRHNIRRFSSRKAGPGDRRFFQATGCRNTYLGFAEENIHFALPPEIGSENLPH